MVKVAAIDAATGIEVSVMGPAKAAQTDLERLALAKLKARLAAGGRVRPPNIGAYPTAHAILGVVGRVWYPPATCSAGLRDCTLSA